MFSSDLLKKFNEPGPYYTSYPTLSEWKQSVDSEVYLTNLSNIFKNSSNLKAGLYVHFPFCPKQCLYCICNAEITSDEVRIKRYLQFLYREIDLLFSQLGSSLYVTDIHLGGGSPSSLGEKDFSELISRLRKWIKWGTFLEFSIEIDPRTVSQEHFDWYKAAGISRLSFGVQDFAPVVQKAINRVQPFALIKSLLSDSVRQNFSGINFDILYGLPLQTCESFLETIHQVIKLSPSRITLLRYAHVPESRRHQQAISHYQRPSEDDMAWMFIEATKAFVKAGWQHIGIDHFALPNDSLAIAARSGTMKRSFIGFTPGWSDNLLGVGTTATVQIGTLYAQNTYSLDEYEAKISENKLPIERGYILNKDDEIRRVVINMILCKRCVDFKSVENQYGIFFPEYFSNELLDLQALVLKGIINLSEQSLQVTNIGQLFLRHICKVFDKFLQSGKKYVINGP